MGQTVNKFINIYFIEYALNSILCDKYKNFFITSVFSILIFLLASIFFVAHSIKYELNSTLANLPQIIVQNIKGGRTELIDKKYVDKILSINGVSDAVDRVWGYYYFEKAGVNFTLVGIDEFDAKYTDTLSKIAQNFQFDSDSMLIGQGVGNILDKNYYKEYFNFIKPNGTIKRVNISGMFSGATDLESNDMIVLQDDTLREIFDIPSNKATDIVVHVTNKEEIATVAIKIKELLPSARIITNEDIKVGYEKIFDYKSGVFLVVFIISFFTFFIIIYDRMSGLSSEQKKEVGILKAVGWSISDILKEKFYEGFILSIFSYLFGVTLSLFYIYILNAPLLKNLFIGYSELKPDFSLPFVFDIQTFMLLFLLSVPIYIASIIIPSWKIATLDADEVMR